VSDISLIVTIVPKGWGNVVLEASLRAGAHGGTTLMGRGSGIHEHQTLLGIPIEPEKEIVLTVAYSNTTESILNEIVRVVDLNKPGAGIAFVVPVDKVVGATHLFGNAPKPDA
jgi:nitrogen regulatory protein PII